MKRILCYGDSITWGYNPADGTRFEYEKTWPGIMEKSLGADYKVITEALTGRTICWDVPYMPYRNGKESLPMLLESHSPLDVVIIMLGVNDLMKMIGKTAEESAWGMLAVIREIMSPLFGGSLPQILIIAPPVIGKMSAFNEMGFSSAAVEESNKLAGCLKILAKETKSEFLDSNEFMKASDVDGLHPLPDEHKKLGEAIAGKVREIFFV